MTECSTTPTRVPPAARIDEAFGNSVDATREMFSEKAATGQGMTLIATALSLADAGLIEIPPALRDTWLAGGDLITLGSVSPGNLQTYIQEAENLLKPVLDVEDIRGSYHDPKAPSVGVSAARATVGHGDHPVTA